MLTKLREAMGDRDSIYRLSDWIEVDDAFVGGKQAGKRGRGAEGKTPVLVVYENRGEKAGFIAKTAVDNVDKSQSRSFLLANYTKINISLQMRTRH